MADLPPGFVTGYTVEMLFRERPVLQKRKLLEALRKRAPGVEPLDGELDDGLCAFVDPNRLTELKDGRIPAQFVVFETQKPVTMSRYETALQQSWGFPAARKTVEGCRANLVAMEFMATWLPYRDRIAWFQDGFAAALEVLDCAAAY